MIIKNVLNDFFENILIPLCEISGIFFFHPFFHLNRRKKSECKRNSVRSSSRPKLNLRRGKIENSRNSSLAAAASYCCYCLWCLWADGRSGLKFITEQVYTTIIRGDPSSFSYIVSSSTVWHETHGTIFPLLAQSKQRPTTPSFPILLHAKIFNLFPKWTMNQQNIVTWFPKQNLNNLKYSSFSLASPCVETPIQLCPLLLHNFPPKLNSVVAWKPHVEKTNCFSQEQRNRKRELRRLQTHLDYHRGGHQNTIFMGIQNNK